MNTISNSDLKIDAHLNLTLDGWPATVAIISICISGILIYKLQTLYNFDR